MTSYSLQSVTGVVGTFSITLLSEFADLIIPTGQSVTGIGMLEEVADISMGISQAAKLSVTLTDDYTAYSEGFWYKILNGDCRIRFYLDQGGGNTFFFFGKPQAETIRWEEHYISSSRIRTVSLDLATVTLTMFDTLTKDWITEFMNYGQVNTAYQVDKEPSWLIRPAGLFAAMLSGSGLNPSYDLNDVSFVWNSGPDMIFLNGAAEFRFDQIYVPTAFYDLLRVGSAGDRPITYWNHNDANYPPYDPPTNSQALELFYPKLQALIGDLLRNFGLVMRMDYDAGAGRHLIQLIQRGRAYSATLDFSSREKESTISKAFDLSGDAVRSVELVDNTKFCWMSKRYSDAPTITEVPNYVSFDVDSPAVFRINATAAQAANNRSLYVWDGTAGHAPVALDGIKYYDYAAQAYVITTATNAKMQEAIGGYIYKRFTADYGLIVRKYGQLKADDGVANDHTRLSILRRTSINDGVSAKTYYANKVRKLVETSECEIEWIRE